MKEKNKMTVAEKKEKEAELEEVEMEKKRAELNAEKVVELRGCPHLQPRGRRERPKKRSGWPSQRRKRRGLQRKLGQRGTATRMMMTAATRMTRGKRVRVLNAEGLALDYQIATSKKRERDLVDGSFHRFVSSEDQCEVPEWLVDDEKKHMNKPIRVRSTRQNGRRSTPGPLNEWPRLRGGC
uniref:Ribosomal RNA methyltransferase SPB1-like C-terminal domain-containing protein n=1 Tax=Hucho hucho TaxID=62062 RepID=A0A4W5QG57_9TELE